LNYQQHKDAALKARYVGESKLDAAVDPTELAAWTTVASTMLNLRRNDYEGIKAMHFDDEYAGHHAGDTFSASAARAIGTAALASLLNPTLFGAPMDVNAKTGGLPGLPHFPPRPSV